MKHLREKFEKLPEIKKKLSMCEWSYSEYLDCYLVDDPCAGSINGAWDVFREQYKIQQEQYKIQQEQQNEILELQNKLSKLKETADWHIEDCSCNHPMSQYQLGWFEAMVLVKEILE